MNDEFPNDPKIIHTTIAILKQNNRYKELLEDFEFLDYDPYPYSPLLGRTFNRLQESRLLSSINPSYDYYKMRRESKEAIEEQIIKVKLSDKIDKLKEIALELQNALDKL
jgi:hypothetical protein